MVKTPGCFTQIHGDVFTQNTRMYYPKTSGCFNGKDVDVVTFQYTSQTGSVLTRNTMSPYTFRVH